jgi:hypothetical protein
VGVGVALLLLAEVEEAFILVELITVVLEAEAPVVF